MIIVPAAGAPVSNMKGRWLTIVDDTKSGINGVYESTPDALLRLNDKEKSGYFSSMLESVYRYALWSPPPQDSELGLTSMKRVGDAIMQRLGNKTLIELPEMEEHKYAGPDTFKTWLENEDFWMLSEKSDVGSDSPNGNPGPDDHPVLDKPDSHVVERLEDNVHHGREP